MTAFLSHKKNMLPKGNPLQVVKLVDCFSEVDENALSSILLDTRVRDNKVMVVSVVGVNEKERSLFLYSFLKFLNSSADEQWMDRPSPEKFRRSFFYGYPWSTDFGAGIYLWSEPFLTTLPSGEHVYILLMETRGLFGNISKECWESEPRCFCRINSKTRNISFEAFGLSAFLSSVMIYNVKADIRSHFHDLQMFTEYARMSLENCTDQPFQNLHFVVHNYNSPEMFPFGDEGGMELLECRKKEVKEQHYISLDSTKSFKKIKCFLMPKMAKNKDSLVVKRNFTSNLRTFTESLFAKNNIEVKTIDGNKVTGSELMKYFKLYAKNFSEHKLRTLAKQHCSCNRLAYRSPLTSCETYEEEVIIAAERAVSFCSWEFEKRYAEKSILNKIDLDELHYRWNKEALRMFRISSSEPEGWFNLDEKHLKKVLDFLHEANSCALRTNLYGETDKASEIYRHYVKKMSERYGKHMPYTSPSLLERDHCRYFYEAMNMFRSLEYHGFEDKQMYDEYELERQICGIYRLYKRLNEAKIKYNSRNGFGSDFSCDLISVDEPVNKMEGGHLKVD